jgi:NAD(P)-dependent dehydrogenase (short-subunit alcohol dehydrogenase family)
MLPILKNSSIASGSECRIVNVASALEQRARASGNADVNTDYLRGNLPSSAGFSDRAKDASSYGGLISGTYWMTEGPTPYLSSTAFSNSMLCIVSSTFELDRRLQKQRVINSSSTTFNITVNAVCPGYVDTTLWADFKMWSIFRKLFFKSPKNGCKIVVKAATSPEYNGVSGQFLSNIHSAQASATSKVPKLAQTVWNFSRKTVGLEVNKHEDIL